jgi:hypothetical protein
MDSYLAKIGDYNMDLQGPSRQEQVISSAAPLPESRPGTMDDRQIVRYDPKIADPLGLERLSHCVQERTSLFLRRSLEAERYASRHLYQHAGGQIAGPIRPSTSMTSDLHISFHAHKIGLTILGSTTLLDVPQTVKDICTAMESYYVVPTVARKCSEFLKEQLENGSYDSITDPETFAQTVTADLRLVSEDKHIVLEFDFPSAELPPAGLSALEIDRPEQYPLPALVHTYTYKAQTKIGWLGGIGEWPHEIKSGYLEEDTRVGYIDMRIFGRCDGLRKDAPPEEGDLAFLNELKKDGDLAFLNELKKVDRENRRAAIMDAVHNLGRAESVIIDLRNNGGGNPQAVQLLCSLFMNEGWPLNTIEYREGEEFKTQSFNTLSTEELPMERRLTNPRVFVLIGPKTFSAAEEFTNNMKVLGRATIVGAPSGGGANPGWNHPIGEKLKLFIPSGRAINPLQGGNWEGVGIIPDHVVPAEEALEKTITLIRE